MEGRELPDTGAGEGLAAPGERRGTGRFRSLCRIARVTRAGDAGLWRVRNISDEGMMLAADVPMALGERIEIALSDSEYMQADVIWVDAGRCGVRFVHAVDAGALLGRLAEEQRTAGYRAPRLSLEAAAVLKLAEGPRAIELVDISHNGAGFLYKGRLKPEETLDLVMAGGAIERRAIIRWARSGRGGLWFTQPLDRSDLESVHRFRS
jgi:hypothetical protein